MGLIFYVKYLKTDEAKATPSYVDVPLPNSSIITKLRNVQFSNIVLVSSNSIKNVDFPSNILSDAPNLQNILSNGTN